MREKILRAVRKARAVIVPLLGIIAIGSALVAASQYAGNQSDPADTGNPNAKPPTAAQIERGRERVAQLRKDKKQWLIRIGKGEASFEEAACEYEHGGTWREEYNECSFPWRAHPVQTR